MEKWKKNKWHFKIAMLLKIPAVFLFTLTTPVINEDKSMSNWNRPLACLHCIISPTLCVAIIGQPNTWVLSLPAPVFSALLGIVVAVVVFFTSKNNERPRYHIAFAFAGFFAITIWIYALANEVINVLQCFGLAWHVSQEFLGLTCLAWGNSLVDCVNNTIIARQGFSKMAIAACYGGVLFSKLPFCRQPCT